MTAIMFFYGKFLMASLMLMTLYWGLLRQRASYRQSRLYLLLLPVVSLLMSGPRLEIYRPAPMVVEVEAEDVSVGVNREMSSTLQAVKAVGHAYIDDKGYEAYVCMGTVFVSAVLLLVALFSILKMYRLRHRVRTVPLTDGCRVVRLAAIDTPFSFIDTIVLPQGMTPRAEDYILRHERSHVRHRHYVDVWLVEVLTRLLWFNPVLWMSRNELRNVHEYEADHDVVLSQDVDLKAYQSLLMEYSVTDSSLLANGFTQSFVRRRFIEMRRSTWGTQGRLGRWSSFTVLLVLFGVFTCTVGEAEVVVKVLPRTSLFPIDAGREGVGEVKAESSTVIDMDNDKGTKVTETDKDSMPSSSPSGTSPADILVEEPARYELFISPFPLNTSTKVLYKGFYLKRMPDVTHLVCVTTPESDDEVYHLGSSDNTYIVDVEHGRHYRARGSHPAGTWAQDFHVQGLKGRSIALTIVFPPLDESTDRVRIYGVGDWNLRGQEFRVKDIEEK